MRTRSVCGFFLTWVGSYENHCFEINAHTFIFQIGYPNYKQHGLQNDAVLVATKNSTQGYILSLLLSHLSQYLPCRFYIEAWILAWLVVRILTWLIFDINSVECVYIPTTASTWFNCIPILIFLVGRNLTTQTLAYTGMHEVWHPLPYQQGFSNFYQLVEFVPYQRQRCWVI